MAAITDLSDLVNRLTGGNSGTPEHLYFFKNARVGGAAAVATVAGRWTDLWTYEGQPSHGVVSTSTGAALDNTTAGGLKQTNPGGGREKWLVSLIANASAAGTLILYDRLAHDGAFDATVTTAQTVSFTPPSRYSDGIGNEIWFIVDTIIGSSATTFTCAYDDQTPAGSTTQAVAIGGTGLREVGRIQRASLEAGDTGVTNITNVDLVATTGTAGAFSIALVHPLVYIPIPAVATGVALDFIAGTPGPIKIESDACLALAWASNGVTAPDVFGNLVMVEA
jgi:hypothetical protein